MALASLTTPAFIVHLPTLVRNTRRVLEHAQRHGVRVRPHIKTHKCLEAASYQLWNELVRDRDTIHQRTAPSLEYARSAVASGITVSTLGEASFFADAGFQDILLAIPLAPRKLPLYDRIRAKVCCTQWNQSVICSRACSQMVARVCVRACGRSNASSC
mgnify:CR=1 FL=1